MNFRDSDTNNRPYRHKVLENCFQRSMALLNKCRFLKNRSLSKDFYTMIIAKKSSKSILKLNLKCFFGENKMSRTKKTPLSLLKTPKNFQKTVKQNYLNRDSTFCDCEFA